MSVCRVDVVKEKPHDTTGKGRVLREHHKCFHVGAERLGAPVHPALDKESTELSLTATEHWLLKQSVPEDPQPGKLSHADEPLPHNASVNIKAEVIQYMVASLTLLIT